MEMNKLFKLTIALMIIFSLAIVYYFYIWITFKPADSLGGDKLQVVYNNVLVG
tara:strand:+ start:238 stop:396 length:159 start_codon:yes stop_codon:yes gene_type:complete